MIELRHFFLRQSRNESFVASSVWNFLGWTAVVDRNRRFSPLIRKSTSDQAGVSAPSMLALGQFGCGELGMSRRRARFECFIPIGFLRAAGGLARLRRCGLIRRLDSAKLQAGPRGSEIRFHAERAARESIDDELGATTSIASGASVCFPDADGWLRRAEK